jgi:uncharacterized iron-regulated membrane protein
MIILFICFALLVVGLIFAFGDYYDWREVFGVIGTTIGGILVFLCLVTIPMQRMSAMAYISKVEASRLTKAVDDSDPIEGAAWRMYAAKTNADLAEARYYNDSLFDIWWPDEIDSVEPIK